MGYLSALRGRGLAAALLGLWLVLWHVHSRFAERTDLGPAFSRWGYVAILLGAAGLCLWRALGDPRERAAWALIGAGAAAWALGDAYFTAELWDDPSPPVPSPADAGYLLLPPLVLGGLVCLLRSHARGLPRALWADGLVAGLAVGAISAALSFDAAVRHVSGSPLEILTNLAYPVADVVLLAVIAGALAGTGWRRDPTLTPLALGVVAFAVADSLYVVQVAEATYEAGGWLDAGWSAGIWAMGFAASRPPMRPVKAPAPEALRPIAVPLGFGSAALALLVFGCFAGLNVLATLFAAGCLLAVMARLLLTFRAHVAMLQASRREALSDPLTALGNRRALQADLIDATADALEHGARHALVAIDLEGVKRFNEALGRPAGDALLVRLGNRLSGLAEAAGARAYRTRGGEFAVLAPLAAGEEAGRLAERLCHPLEERIEGIEIRCHGAGVEIGRDATTVAAALRLVEQRLAERRPAPQNA